MGQKQISKWAVLPPIMLMAFAEALILVPAFHQGRHFEALIAGAMSFAWFHIAKMCMKHGVQPWRVVPALTLASVAFGGRAIELFVRGNALEALMPVLGCIVWGYAAYKANVLRKSIEAEDGKA